MDNKILEIFIPGPVGRLEAKYYKSKKNTSPIALVLQPHPQYGGTMNNKVVVETFKTFMDNDFSVCRVNFRGVGKSDGEFDNGQGELADAAAALDWLERENFDNSQCWVSGFSFGSLIAMQLLMRRPEINRFIAISPQPNVYDFSFLSPCPTSGLVAYGVHEFDEVPKYRAMSEIQILESEYSSSEATPLQLERLETAKAELKEAKVVMKNNEIWNINDKGPVLAFNIDDGGNPRPLFSDKGALGQIFKGFFGYNGNPSYREVIAYLFTLAMVSFLWTRASQGSPAVVKDEKSPMNEKCPTCFEEVDAQASSSCSNCDTDLDFS